jgi:hypothetical protein
VSRFSIDSHNCSIQITSARLIAEIILSPFNLPFRLHTWLSREPWAKLWYTLRALDQEGKGYYQVPIELVEALTGADSKTIYRWLQDGRSAGAFRRYKIRDGILRVWMGSLFAVCQKMNLANWGAVAVVNLLEISKIRALTTATATQFLQQKSRYAANSQLKKEFRQFYGSPHPNELVPDKLQSSLKSETGQVHLVLHTSETRLFVSKNFTAFGTSQNAISCNLGIHTRTVQRHQAAVNMASRQLCQAKGEYAWIAKSWEMELSDYLANETTTNKKIGYKTLPEVIAFSDGIPPGAKKSGQANQWNIPQEDFGRRFFAIGSKTKKWFMAKCNIYRESLVLTSMRAARKALRAQITSDNTTGTVTVSKNPAVGLAGRCHDIPAPTGK